jgi:probable rRNA maturation factor
VPNRLTSGPAILNRQRRVRVSVQNLEEFIARARRALGLPDESFTICLVSDTEMASWNLAYRGKKSSTDVLSFPLNRKGPIGRKPSSRRDREPFSIPSLLSADPYIGDIAIAPAVARRNAKSWGRTLEDEMRILILHGMLHLLGYDHETDTGQMDRREHRLRRALGLA